MYLAVIPTLFKSGRGRIPEIGVELEEAAIGEEELNAYRSICSFKPGGKVPSTFLHAYIFPLQSILLSHSKFPYPMLGLIHFANSIRQYRELQVGEKFSAKCWLGKSYSHEKGQAFDIRCEIRVGRELVWEESSIILHKGKVGEGELLDWKQPVLEPTCSKEVWEMPSNLGRRFAKVSGDFNPIHLYPLTAKLFGFKRNIAHGMWSLGKALGKYEDKVGESYELTVLFKTPVLLPAKVIYREQQGVLGYEFDLVDKNEEKPHLKAYLKPM